MASKKTSVKTNDIALALINENLGLNINHSEIQRSHRVGPKTDKSNLLRSAKPRIQPIIVRFTDYETRHKVFKIKKLLKGTKMSISENLTITRYNLLKKAAEKYGKNMVWSHEGRIMTKINGMYVIINSLDDLKN